MEFSKNQSFLQEKLAKDEAEITKDKANLFQISLDGFLQKGTLNSFAPWKLCWRCGHLCSAGDFEFTKQTWIGLVVKLDPQH